ncbi:Ldh family oxidoreductase [Umezawaea endophytica]|uniref:Ldh family oxidoreductase n=1 Tax=Umezawaea endophytica TaxID=1654476 RepID=A0A9X3AF58_9PSEU|nr:Ldh family oxidoreductase [Umezawaea endophytica]MCS7477826.1 Ldh family oxidoreductase [Umezawaea endophytica]
MRVDHPELRDFASRCLTAVGVSDEDAATVVDVLVSADLRGVDSHGVARLRRYVDGVRAGTIDPRAAAVVMTETPATATLDAGNGLGQPASCAAVDLAMAKAAETGLGMVTVRRSNHFGIAGYYALRAARRGLFAIVGTNASPQVAPTYGARPMFGTNPLAVAFPTDAERPFVFDAATSIVPRGKLERLHRQGDDMAPGWAIDPNGESTTDLPSVVSGLKERTGYALLPLGGEGDSHGGHKGYGLATVVELLCGPLAGARWGRHVYGPEGAGLGHFFLCGQVAAVTTEEEFRAEANRMFDELRASPKARGRDRILIAGEREHEIEQERLATGIPLRPAVVADLARVGAECGVAPLTATTGVTRAGRDRNADTADGGRR